MKVLIIGIGNELRRDDAVGPIVAQKLSGRISHDNVDIKKTPALGLSLMEDIKNYDFVFIVDSIKTKKGKPGDWYKLSIDDFATEIGGISSHAIDLNTIRKIVGRTGEPVPEICIFGVEVVDPFTFDEGLSGEVKVAIAGIVEGIAREIDREFST